MWPAGEELHSAALGMVRGAQPASVEGRLTCNETVSPLLVVGRRGWLSICEDNEQAALAG